MEVRGFGVREAFLPKNETFPLLQNKKKIYNIIWKGNTK